jgi:polyisoprenoid-binding protein YceI
VVNFSLKASVATAAKFDKWDATLTFPSTDVTTGLFDTKIQAGSVNTGSGVKDDKPKGKDFFDAKDHRTSRFIQDKIVQTDPITFVNGILFASI